jgi:hypothetical protein
MANPLRNDSPSARRRASMVRFLIVRERRMLLLLLLLLVAAFVLPAVLPSGPAGRLGMGIMLTLLLVAGVLAVAEHREIVKVLVVMSVLSIAVRWTEWFVPSTLLPGARELSMLLALLVLAVAVGVNVFGKGKTVAERIIGAIVLYLLIGLQWALAYETLDQYVPGAFTVAAGHVDFDWVYFSFVTLTTVGYGDITPVARAARSLAILEALVGQLYPAVVLARLVSLPQDEKPKNGAA